jgi:uncharacterized membrane protein YczE
VASALRSGHRRLLGRSLQLVLGCSLATWCYALTIRAGIGLGPLFVVQQGVARTTGMSIGHAVMLVGLGLIVTAMLLRTWPGPGTIVLPFLGGAILDTVLPVAPAVHGIGLEIVVVLVSTWVMALGGALVIRGAVGVAAYDAVMLGLARLTGLPLAPVRLAMELTMLGCGWLIGGTVGLGTVLTGVLIGPSLQFWMKLLGATATGSARPIQATAH